MIYFIKDTVTQAIKIGYSRKPEGRLAMLQTAAANPLILLGAIQGGIEHEAAFHNQFATHRLQGEWFKGHILPEVLRVLAHEAANPQPIKINVIVAGDSEPPFLWSTDPKQMATKHQMERLLCQALTELHANRPIAWIVTGGERTLEQLAWEWAGRNSVRVQRYYPKWNKHGRAAGARLLPRLLRTQFDPKVLLVCVSSKTSAGVKSLIRCAAKARIETITVNLATG